MYGKEELNHRLSSFIDSYVLPKVIELYYVESYR